MIYDTFVVLISHILTIVVILIFLFFFNHFLRIFCLIVKIKASKTSSIIDIT